MAFKLTDPKTGKQFIMRKKPPQPMKTLHSRWTKAASKKRA